MGPTSNEREGERGIREEGKGRIRKQEGKGWEKKGGKGMGQPPQYFGLEPPLLGNRQGPGTLGHPRRGQASFPDDHIHDCDSPPELPPRTPLGDRLHLQRDHYRSNLSLD